MSILRALVILNHVTRSQSLHYFGFDLDSLAGGGYEDLAQLLNYLPNLPLLQELEKLLARVPGETLKEEIDRLDITLAWISDRKLSFFTSI